MKITTIFVFFLFTLATVEAHANSLIRKDHSLSNEKRRPIARRRPILTPRRGRTPNPGRTRRPPTVNPGRRQPGPVIRPTENPRHRSVSRRRVRPQRSYYGTRNYHRPYHYSPVPYTRYVHRPYLNRVAHAVHYTPFTYYWNLRNTYSRFIYVHWIFYPSTLTIGYHYLDNYPYYVYGGYRHRYSAFDTCNYQLVDSYTHNVVLNFYGRICQDGYNQCALTRDRQNRSAMDSRYFCAETYRDEYYDYSTSTYELEEEYPTYDEEYDAYENGTCLDYDYQTNVCYDHY